jgi:hypothetical protein
VVKAKEGLEESTVQIVRKDGQAGEFSSCELIQPHLRGGKLAGIVAFAGWTAIMCPTVVFTAVTFFRTGKVYQAVVLAAISLNKFQQISYSCYGLVPMIYVTCLLLSNMTHLTNSIQREINRSEELSYQDIAFVAAAVQSTIDRTTETCKGLNPTLKIWAVYITLSTTMLVLALVINLTEEVRSERALVPAWLVAIFTTYVVVFLALVTLTGLVNIKTKRLKSTLAHLLVRLSVNAGQNRPTDSAEKIDERRNMYETINALIQMNTEIANLFGIPITPRMISNMWSQAAFATLLAGQFIYFRQDIFTYHFIPLKVA